MKIAILTQPLHSNYGGLLQAYALQKVLRDRGHEVVTDRVGVPRQLNFWKKLNHFINCLFKKYLRGSIAHNPYQFLFTSLYRISEREQVATRAFKPFIEKHIKSCDLFQGKTKASDECCQHYDAFIVGSDQIWRPAYAHTPAYFLDFLGDMPKKRVAYAASFGIDTIKKFKPAILKKCQQAAPLFNAISVREDTGVDLCKNHFNVEAEHVLDPTLLLTQKDYIDLINEENHPPLQQALSYYILDEKAEKKLIVDKIASSLRLKPVKLMPKETWKKETNNIDDCIYPTIAQWLQGFRDAQFVVTDSFHGTVFAIIFNKPFVAIANSHRGASRFTSLLKIFHLESRLITSIDDLKEEHLGSINYEQVKQIMSQWQHRSIDFLSAALQD